MSDDSDSIIIEQSNLEPMSHRRILWTMAIIAVIGSLTSFFLVSGRFGAGVFFGGILSFVNYYWLKISLRKIFESAVASGQKQRFLAIRYFSRYLTLGIVLVFVFLTKIVPIIAVVLGLSSFALAIMIEGFIRLFSTFFKSKEL